MKLSTRGRYAVQALVDIANSGDLKPVSIVDIALRQNLSQQYLEQLFAKLRQNDIVYSVRGQTGGYFLTRKPHEITIAQIIDAVDEPIKSTNCSVNSALGCMGNTTKCISHNLWAGMEIAIRNYLSGIRLADVVDRRIDRFGNVVDESVGVEFCSNTIRSAN